MNRLLPILFALLLAATSSNAANWFVTPAGSGNGTDWNNAWSMAQLNAGWSSVQPGDTVWLAGGVYTNTMTPTKSGNSTNWIYIRRVLSTDATPAATAGWNASFDSQVIIAPVAAYDIFWDTTANGSYLYIDGRVPKGISCRMDNNAEYGAGYVGCITVPPGATANNVTVTNVELAGPSPDNGPYAYNTSASACGISLHNATPGNWQVCSNWTFSHCDVHGALDLIFAEQYTGLTFDHCAFYDNNDNGVGNHANVFEDLQNNNVVFRYCTFHDWMAEGIMPYGYWTNLLVYGCVFHDALTNSGAAPSCIGPGGTTVPNQGPIFFYNNTVYNVSTVWRGFGLTNYLPCSTSQCRNNLYWNVGEDYPVTDNDYNYGNFLPAGGNSVNGTGATPFVSVATTNLQITATVATNYPRNKGQTLSAIAGQTLNLDPLGNVRGVDGAWDIGAYEYATSTGKTYAPVRK